jgi:hypothetical protein
MTDDNKPREFFVFPEQHLCLEPGGQAAIGMTGEQQFIPHIRVIEYSAYAALRKENEELKDDNKIKFNLIMEHGQINAALGKENEELKHDLETIRDYEKSTLGVAHAEIKELKKWNEQQRIYFDENAALRESLKSLVEAAKNIKIKFDGDLPFIGGISTLNDVIDEIKTKHGDLK